MYVHLFYSSTISSAQSKVPIQLLLEHTHDSGFDYVIPTPIRRDKIVYP